MGIYVNLSMDELAELLYACDFAIKKEMEMAEKYKDIMPWRFQRHEQSIANLKSAKAKLNQALQKI